MTFGPRCFFFRSSPRSSFCEGGNPFMASTWVTVDHNTIPIDKTIKNVSETKKHILAIVGHAMPKCCKDLRRVASWHNGMTPVWQNAGLEDGNPTGIRTHQWPDPNSWLQLCTISCCSFIRSVRLSPLRIFFRIQNSVWAPDHIACHPCKLFPHHFLLSFFAYPQTDTPLRREKNLQKVDMNTEYHTIIILKIRQVQVATSGWHHIQVLILRMFFGSWFKLTFKIFTKSNPNLPAAPWRHT